jgi:hypothetical protein
MELYTHMPLRIWFIWEGVVCGRKAKTESLQGLNKGFRGRVGGMRDLGLNGSMKVKVQTEATCKLGLEYGDRRRRYSSFGRQAMSNLNRNHGSTLHVAFSLKMKSSNSLHAHSSWSSYSPTDSISGALSCCISLSLLDFFL